MASSTNSTLSFSQTRIPPEGEGPADVTSVQIDADADLDEILAAFERFLRGAGFHFDGQVVLFQESIAEQL